MPHFTANNLNLNYLDSGNPTAPAVLAIHGLRGNAHAFDPLAKHLANRFRVIAPDVRGRGDSDWSKDGKYEYADYVSDLEALVEHLQLDRFRLIGTSMGGRIAMVYAKQHGGRLERLVLNDIGPDNEAGGDRITAEAASAPDDFASLAEVLAYRRKTFPATASLAEDAQRATALTLYKEIDGRWIAKADPEFLRQRARSGAHGIPEAWDTLAKLECPLMVIWGTISDVLSESQAKKIVATSKDARLIPIPGVGHAPSLTEPEALAALDVFL